VARQRTGQASVAGSAARGGAAGKDAVGVYLDEIARTPLLSADEEVDLSRRIEAGVYAQGLLDREQTDGRDVPGLAAVAADGALARSHMVQANLRLVVSVARRYAHAGLPFLDVVQEGNLGLLRAVEKFDYAKGYKFSTYAVWWIRKAITQALADQSRTIRVPAHLVEQQNKLRRLQRELTVRLGREPSVEELADAIGRTPEQVQELRRLERDPISLDAPLDEASDTRVGELLEDVTAPVPSAEVERWAAREQVRRVVAELPEREAAIVMMRFGLVDGRPRTLEETGRSVGLTRERIRQLEREALDKLRHSEARDALLDVAS
jgi:RNA polymerase sigma factor (sigma-70 family)